MQAAYASGVKISSTRHLNRLRRLEELIAEAGSATALAMKIATPKSHISALQAGARGIGDTLAAKLERKFDKPAGWMDLPAGAADLTMSELNGFEGQLVTLFRQLGADTQHDTLIELNNKVGARATKPSTAAPFGKSKAGETRPPAGTDEPLRGATPIGQNNERGGWQMTAEQKRRAAAKKKGS